MQAQILVLSQNEKELKNGR